MNQYGAIHPRRVLAWVVSAFLVLVGVSIALSLLFVRPATGPFYPFFPFGGFFVIFWFFAIFWLVRWLVWPWGGHWARRSWGYRDASYDILRERYARGEITQEQFEEMTRNLDQHRTPDRHI